MTLTFELDLYTVKVNQRAKHTGQRSLRSAVIVRAQTYTLDRLGLLDLDH